MNLPIIIFILTAINGQAILANNECNEAICASIVSKCTLLKSCECEMDLSQPSGCSCCKKCYACLDYLAVECCSCVGLCPTKNSTVDNSNLETKSIVVDIKKPTPALWDALMEGQDHRWDKLTFPVNVQLQKTNIQETILDNDLHSLNCTVAFLVDEMGDTKCEKSCGSMGANSYRWFNNGCCQCVGHSCINYGVNEARCGFVVEEDNEEDEAVVNFEDLSEEQIRELEVEYGLVEEEEDSINRPED